MTLPFVPDTELALPPDRERADVIARLAGVEYEVLFRTASRDVWQIESCAAPHAIKAALAARGFDVVSVEDAALDYLPCCAARFMPPYAPDADWPAMPYFPEPAPPPALPWARVPKTLKTDAVAGPGGVVLCDLDAVPAARVPIPGVSRPPYRRAKANAPIHRPVKRDRR